MTEEKSQKKYGFEVDLSGNDWDDTLLIKAYDESLLLAKAEVAKKIAKATNKKTSADKKEKATSSTSQKKLEEGDFVRSTYTDGIDYEAKILKKIDEGKTCLIRYLGYDNEEFVKTHDLLPSWGKKAIKQQKQAAHKEKTSKHGRLEDFTSENSQISSGSDDDDGGEEDEEEDYQAEPQIFANTKPSKRKQFKQHTQQSGHSMNFTSGFSVPPPPPMPPMLEDCEDAENLSAMLMSWYMSGYYTGLYQGQKISRTRSNFN